jgi:hypothetical protein
MAAKTSMQRYRPTEAKFKGGAKEMYVTYDLDRKMRSGAISTYPKIKRVYIAGDVKKWKVGTFAKRTGRRVRGMRIEYEQTRSPYHRESYSAEREGTRYNVAPASVSKTSQRFVQIVEVPEAAENIQFHANAEGLPDRYRHALQRVR